jgi:hypothetical protein
MNDIVVLPLLEFIAEFLFYFSSPNTFLFISTHTGNATKKAALSKQ